MSSVNPNNSTGDPTVLWEDGTWAIIEAGDYPPGIGRSKTRDPGDLAGTLGASWEPSLLTPPGPQAVREKKWLKVKLADYLAAPKKATGISPPIPFNINNPRAFQDPKTPIAPPSPFLPKPWKSVPEFPYVCPTCGGRFVQLAISSIHEMTEQDPVLRGRCPGVDGMRTILKSKGLTAKAKSP